MNKNKTTITFTSEHLVVIQRALESYSRAKMGQFRNWLTETFGWQYDCDTGADIEKFIRLRTLEQYLEKKYGKVEVANKRNDFFFGDSPYFCENEVTVNDTTDPKVFLSHYEKFLFSFPVTQDEPFPRETNASWGILQKEKVGDGQLAYEIYQTIRQYTAVVQNGGLFDHYTSSQDPLNYSGVDLPEIQGFVKHKDYYFNQTESRRLAAYCEKKAWNKAWNYINKTLTPKYKIPSGESYKIMWNETPTKYLDVSGVTKEGIDPTSYFIRVFKPQKEEKSLDAAPKTT